MSMPTLPIMHTLAKHSPPSPQLTKGWRLVCFLRNFRNEGVGRFYGACPKPVRSQFFSLKSKKCTFFTFFLKIIWRKVNVRRNFALAFGSETAQTEASRLRYSLVKAAPTSALPTTNSLRLGLRRGPRYHPKPLLRRGKQRERSGKMG